MIDKVDVYLEYPEERLGVTLIESIFCYDQNGKEIREEKLSDSIYTKEFFDEEYDEIGVEGRVRAFVAKELNVSIDIVEVIE
ncbi:hypothetical protein MC28_1528 [Bacillus thuringiensis MC28]|nr:hypothetical protein MC28_1528 [Bacillus thuringiensis MC28]